MSSTLKGKPKSKVALKPLYTRVFGHQDEFVKQEVKRSKKPKLSEGALYRELIDLGIAVYKSKNK